jgi:squalene-hopene/tetraprenyl-beta-curcumene cyclase
MIDRQRLAHAYHSARAALLAERNAAGHWVGELSSSALSTATAVSALAVATHGASHDRRGPYQMLIDGGVRWILERQNADGGWGDTDLSLSNIATTMLVRAALHLSGRAEGNAVALRRADKYIAAQGDVDGLRRRYGKDKTFAVPILTNCALAGLVEWNEVSPLPFEMACLPQSWYRFAGLPVVSYAIPALVAIGQARYHHSPPWNPITWTMRRLSLKRSLNVLERMQPASGGYLEATPLTSFVVMSLSSIGLHRHPVTLHGLNFLVESARGDGSWPIDTNLATWVTTLSINALGPELAGEQYLSDELQDWVLSCQQTQRHPFTGAAPGGWGWSDLSGAVPDADDTPGAMLALQHFQHTDAAQAGAGWLRGLQNSDGGWPTFCRGWGKLPFDRSGSDLTAHALRALHVEGDADRPIRRGLRYLRKHQRRDGSWLPLWFGNQHQPNDENPLYGTARVLAAYRDLGRMDDPQAQRGVDFLLRQQNDDGGWGGGHSELVGPRPEARKPKSGVIALPPLPPPATFSSVEETALVVEALCAARGRPEIAAAVDRGVQWLVEAVESGRFRTPSPIGFYFAKLWYYEKLYPLIFTVGALRAATEGMDV